MKSCPEVLLNPARQAVDGPAERWVQREGRGLCDLWLV